MTTQQDAMDRAGETGEVVFGCARSAESDAQPLAYVNGDELDNMLDDRTAVIQGTRSGFRNTPLYAAAQPCASQGCGGAVDEVLQFAPKLPGVNSPEPTLERIIWRYYSSAMDDEQDARHFAKLYVDALRAALSTDKSAQ